MAAFNLNEFKLNSFPPTNIFKIKNLNISENFVEFPLIEAADGDWQRGRKEINIPER